jgi:hypothetical protein
MSLHISQAWHMLSSRHLSEGWVHSSFNISILLQTISGRFSIVLGRTLSDTATIDTSQPPGRGKGCSMRNPLWEHRTKSKFSQTKNGAELSTSFLSRTKNPQNWYLEKWLKKKRSSNIGKKKKIKLQTLAYNRRAWNTIVAVLCPNGS